jgi:hypothetical protein
MIAETIVKQAGKKYRSTSWWVNNLMNELMKVQDRSQKEIIPGDLVFFMYSAKYPQRYDYWDQYPLSYIMEMDKSKGIFLGSNLHYLNPQYRGGVAQSYINKFGFVNAPKKTLHNYLFSNVMSDMFIVPESEWREVSLLPTEKFVNKRGQPVFKTTVWDAP